jgi:hypothetical protein
MSTERPHTLEATDRTPRPRRILVLANETGAGPALFEELAYRTRGQPSDVRIVAPALTSRARYWVSDEDAGIADAERRLNATLSRCEAAGIAARGEVGDSDPLLALDDAMRTYKPDEVIIATHLPARSNWLEEGIVAQARSRFPEALITHVVVDVEHESSTVTPVEAEEPVRREHGRRDLTMVVIAGVLALLGTMFTVLFYASDAPGWLIVLWVLVVDLGTKAFAFALLWTLFQRRPRADRLDF